jgi:ubiquinone/menaquinone biosynthesis C-methylase UbiE
MNNLDAKTVAGFGDEWTKFDQQGLSPEEHQELFERYFKIFPWETLPPNAVGFDLGCGSGRWAKSVAPRVGKLHCIDASEAAIEVARRNLAQQDNCECHLASVDHIPLPDASMDFGYSLGVLHHVPDTAAGIRSCVQKLKPDAPFLLYLYYAFDNRPRWFRLLWRISDAVRQLISKLPSRAKYLITSGIALFIYFPLARFAAMLEKLGLDVDSFPLSTYRHLSFYTMRTDAFDRFATRLEQRFTLLQIKQMMTDAGLERVRHSSSMPYWCVLGYRKAVD